MRKGFFITFESTAEGVGKTTQVKAVTEALRAFGMDVVSTREPGGTKVGAQLREIILDKRSNLSKATELLLLVADRAQHYKEVLKPALRGGKVVISDRYFDSTLVYQGWGRGWKTALLVRLHQVATGSLLPDLTIVLDGTPFRKKPNNDALESLGAEFHKKVKRGLLHLASRDPVRYVVVKVDGVDETAMTQRIVSIIQERINLPNTTHS